MRIVHVCVIAVVAAAFGSLATMAAQGQKPIQRSTVFDWTKLEAKTTQVGVRRDVMRAPTPTLDELEIHISTLKPGQSPHAPHQHQHEELLILKEGTLETFQSGATRKVGPGGIIFQASNIPHTIRNAGDTPATYHVMQWLSPGLKK